MTDRWWLWLEYRLIRERESHGCGWGEVGDDRVFDFAAEGEEGLFFFFLVFRAEGFSLCCGNGRTRMAGVEWGGLGYPDGCTNLEERVIPWVRSRC